MYQFVGDINDKQVSGLEPILNYVNGNLYTKGDYAINQHRYNFIINKVTSFIIAD